MQLRKGHLWLSPSDVTAFLACEHLTTLQLRVARGELTVTGEPNEQAELVFRKGLEHERAFLAQLSKEGKSVAEIALEPDLDWERAQRETVAAMRSGVDVVYQGVFGDGGWRGVADFLLRAETPSELGAWSYEALDTKLARSAKRRTSSSCASTTSSSRGCRDERRSGSTCCSARASSRAFARTRAGSHRPSSPHSGASNYFGQRWN